MIDSHCHLSQADYDVSVNDLIDLAHKTGVEKMLDIACDTNDWEELLTTIKDNKNVYGAIGIHPEYALKYEDSFLKKLPELFEKNPKLLGVGEIGLDYSDKTIDSEKQIALFEKQIQIAHKIKKPIIIHTREAEADTLSILDKAYRLGKLENSGIIHCFTGSSDFAQKSLDFGFYISISGIITFKSASKLRETVKEIPLDRLLIETDCPWLAPEPYRGQKNQPCRIVKTLEKLAELKGISVAELDKITTENFNRLFKEEK